jgi:hypothetical protein
MMQQGVGKMLFLKAHKTKQTITNCSTSNRGYTGNDPKHEMMMLMINHGTITQLSKCTI